MKRISGVTLLNTVFTFAAVSGWVLWGVSAMTAHHLQQEYVQFEELNYVLLHDLKDFKSENDALKAAWPAKTDNGRESALVADLKQKNKHLRSALENLKKTYRRKLRDILAADAALGETVIPPATLPPRVETGAVRLGTLAVTGMGAAFHEGSVPAGTNKNVRPAGRIVSVDPDGEFVVINLGSEANIRPGSAFTIRRGHKAIAHLSALEVRSRLSACQITCVEPDCAPGVNDPVYLALEK